jgi:GTPase SAR1 family protein
MPTDEVPVRDIDVPDDASPSVTGRDISGAPAVTPTTKRAPAKKEGAKKKAPAKKQPTSRIAPPEAQAPEHGPPPDKILAGVERLRTHIATLPLAFAVPGIEDARRERDTLMAQLDDYLLPRLRRRDAPLLAVIGGSTGAGKSTLTNSLVRREVSRSGVLRPTTRSPVLVHHPSDSGAFMSQRILPGLTRVTSEAPEPIQPIDPHAPRVTGLRLVPHDGIAPGLALVDAPDIDSLVDTNRDLAVQLLDAADLWIFVTTAARYADAMPWQMLEQAVQRGVTVAIVLDRVPPDSLQDLRLHLASRLRDRGLGSSPVFVVPESELAGGLLPPHVVAPLLTWLQRLGGSERAREVVAMRTLSGIVGSLPARALRLADAADVQAVAGDELVQVVHEAFAERNELLAKRLTDGSMMRGEILARWQELMADGGLLRRLEAPRPTGLGGRLKAMFRPPEPERPVPLSTIVTDGVAAAIRAADRAAIDQIVTRWRLGPAGTGVVEARAAAMTTDDLEPQLEQAVGAWRDGVLALADTAVRQAVSEGFPAAPDLDTVAGVAMVAALHPPPPEPRGEGDETGDDATSLTPAAATSAAATRILGAVIGDEPVRVVAERARADLAARAATLLDGERARLERLLDSYGAPAGRGAALRAAVQVLSGGAPT